MDATQSLTPVPLVRIARPPTANNEKMILLPLEIKLKAFSSVLSEEMLMQLQDEFAPYLNQDRYPVLVGNQLLDRVCELALPDQSIAAARQLLGYKYLMLYQASFLGILLAPVEPGGEFEWVMRGLPRNYAAATNYGTYWIAELGPRHWRFDFEDDPGYPEFVLGGLVAGGELLQMPCHEIACSILSPEHYSFDITWGERES